MKGRKNGKGCKTQKKHAVYWTQRRGRIPIYLIFKNLHALATEQLGKGDSHRTTGQETHTYLDNPLFIYFYQIIWHCLHRPSPVSCSFFHQDSGRVWQAFENTFLSQNFQSSSKWVYFCSISLLFSSTAVLVMTWSSAIALNRTDTESLFYRSPWNLTQKTTLCLPVSSSA